MVYRMLLPTSLVGSYPQPEWLIDRVRLSKQVPRVRVDDLWLIAPDKLEAAQDDATILAIRDQERAGIEWVVRAQPGGTVRLTARHERAGVVRAEVTLG